MRLLVVEDEPGLAAYARELAAGIGFAVDTADRLETARHFVTTTAYDAIVLDLALPDGDGLSFVAKLRAERRGVPVLAVTARDGVEARIAGLDAGADDYLEKPFDGREFRARLRALLRRPSGALGVVLETGDLRFDTVARAARARGKPLALARHELAALEALMRASGRVVTRAALFEALYDHDTTPESDPVNVHVHHLRRKLAAAGSAARIVTFRGLGYMLEADSP